MTEQLLNLSGLLQQRQRLRVQQPPMLIDDQTFTDTIEQLHAQLPFEVGQRRTDCRLR
ncbi:hypothetical protein D3C85_1813570 [compost metagenome]